MCERCDVSVTMGACKALFWENGSESVFSPLAGATKQQYNSATHTTTRIIIGKWRKRREYPAKEWIAQFYARRGRLPSVIFRHTKKWETDAKKRFDLSPTLWFLKAVFTCLQRQSSHGCTQFLHLLRRQSFWWDLAFLRRNPVMVQSRSRKRQSERE